MRTMLRLFAGLLLTATGTAAAEAFPPLPDVHKVRLREAFHLVETLGPTVWPEFDGRGAPVLLIAGETEYLLNQDEAPGGFAPIANDDFNGRPVFARPRTLAPNLRAAFPAIGKETVVVGTAEQTELSPTAWTVIVGHELFHVYQDRRGLNKKIRSLAIGPADDANWHLNFPFPYQDRDVQYAMHLLGYSLYRTVTLPGDADKSEVSYDARTAYEALSNLLTLLENRYRDPRQANYLRFQTMSEGVARYVEYRLARQAALSDYQPQADFAAAPGVVSYQELWRQKYETQLFLIKHAGRVSRSRTEFYGLGHGLAMVLDRTDPSWVDCYFDPGVWLDTLLKASLGIPEPVPAVGSAAPLFVLEEAHGGALSLESLRGRPVLVDFWEEWCLPCVESTSFLADLADKQGAHLLLLTDPETSPKAAETLARLLPASKAPPRLLFVTPEVTRAYGVDSYPMMFVIDADGRIAYWKRSYTPGEEKTIAAAVRQAMSPAAAAK